VKITVITTLLNEGDNLNGLMASVLQQTRKPEEMVVVDGGSTDGTLEKLAQWKPKFETADIVLKLAQAKGANIARGRNLAVERASHEWIAGIDGGCVAEKTWLEQMAKKAEESHADVVSGNFRATAETFPEKIQGVFARISARDNPSSRSVMFRKKIWKKAGGYPEKLYTGEDTLFNARMKEAGAKFVFAPGAMVNWKMRTTLKKWLKQFYLYGYGDGRAGVKLNTWYGRKVGVLVAGLYGWMVASSFFPVLLVLPWLAGAVYGLYRQFSMAGLVGGLLYPFRLLVFLAGLHFGWLERVRKQSMTQPLSKPESGRKKQ